MIKRLSDEDTFCYMGKRMDGMNALLLNMMLQGTLRWYSPRKKVLAAAIGTGDSRKEGSLIRAFHNIQDGIVPQDVRVIGCDISTRHPSEDGNLGASHGDYYAEIRGPQGNASYDVFWRLALNHSDGVPTCFDFVYIGFPDYVPSSNWPAVFSRALDYLSPTGEIVTISEGSRDLEKQRAIFSSLSAEGALIFPEKRFIFSLGSEDLDFSLRTIMRGQQKTLF